MLESNWKTIRDEGMSAMKLKGLYQDEAENLRDVGDWKQFQLFARGKIPGVSCPLNSWIHAFKHPCFMPIKFE